MFGARRRVYNLAFEDNDDDLVNVVRRPRWIREREDHFHDLDDRDFKVRYRLSKESVMLVLEQIENNLEFQTDKNSSLSPMNQLLCALRYYATGCFQISIGDLGGFSKSTAHRCIHKVSRAIAMLRPAYVKFPEEAAEIRRTQIDFHRKARFPRVIGAIDCTHIRLLKSPGGENAELFRNRKGYLSLNVQAICNANMEFTDVVARWPGSTHDSHIFNNCYRRTQFEQGRYNDAVLLGDSGYACKAYMMTPLDMCHTEAEQLYNEAQIRTRNVIERTFGVWKRRFPAIALGLRLDLDNCFPVIVSTMVLHNIARKAGDEIPRDDDQLHLPAPWEELLAEGNVHGVNERVLRRGNPNHQQRRLLIDNYFSNLAIQQQIDRRQ